MEWLPSWKLTIDMQEEREHQRISHCSGTLLTTHWQEVAPHHHPTTILQGEHRRPQGSRELCSIRYTEEEANRASINISNGHHRSKIIEWPSRESKPRFVVHLIKTWVRSFPPPLPFLFSLPSPSSSLRPPPLPSSFSSFSLSFSPNYYISITYLEGMGVTSGNKMIKNLALPSALIKFIIKWKSQMMEKVIQSCEKR